MFLAVGAGAKDTAEAKSEKVTDVEGAWLARAMQGTTAYGKDEFEVGEVQEIVIGVDGRIAELVIRLGSFVEVSNQTLSVPWDQVDMTPDRDGITVSVDIDTIGDEIGITETTNERMKSGAFLAGDLIGDEVHLKDDSVVGDVHDLIFAGDGRLAGLVVVPNVSTELTGYYGVPFTGQGGDDGAGFDPAEDHYDLALTEEEFTASEPLNTDLYEEGTL
ncbi:MAG: PRC-barrel domain-containing protein [Geminicoccaceae bacterium]